MTPTATREDRRALETGGVAFVGSREDLSAVFDYTLRDVSGGGVGFAVAETAGDGLSEGARINFHLPFRVDEVFRDQGVVRWRRRAGDGWECGAQLDGRIPLYYPIYAHFEDERITFRTGVEGRQRLDDVLEIILKDAWLLKRGIGVYFDHLAPYFRRLGRREGREFTDRVRAAIDHNVGRLDLLRLSLAEPGARTRPWSPGEFRAAIEPELRPEEFEQQFATRAVAPYLESIKRLEYRLYTNFNVTVLLNAERNRRLAAHS